MISNHKLDSAISEVEIRQVELEPNAREQEKQRECQLKLKQLEVREIGNSCQERVGLEGKGASNEERTGAQGKGIGHGAKVKRTETQEQRYTSN